MSNRTYIFLKGLKAPIDFTDCPQVVAILPDILIFWEFEISNTNHSGLLPFYAARPCAKGYTALSPYFDKPKTYPDAVNTACALVAELAWEQLRNDPGLLNVHAAAVEFNGRLLLIPNRRRAGKSTLTTALAARGHKVFTDDFLPLAINDDNLVCGVASGIAPRLRRPIPKGFGVDNLEFVKTHAGPSNKQYQYVELDKSNLAINGEMLPIGGVMVLDREDGKNVEMAEIDQGDVLKALIVQNFAREMNSVGVLQILDFLVANAKCRELRYQDTEQVIELIEQTFAQWEAPVCKFEADKSATDFQPVSEKKPANSLLTFQPEEPLLQATGVTIRDLGSKKFLSDRNGHAIHQLNATSAAIWQLLEEPTSLIEMTEIFRQAFPHNDVEKMRKDINDTLLHMSRAGLVRTAEIAQPSESAAYG